ncbi:MBL fold metallo-hydrolase [Lewinella sp. IMCC34191]|uniref:MBL fold metallo-hydrolase n=1 Tax=Lewinella sp. IMCC34191 TaxID=2259172 RepID=UPI000E2727C4|nr:MBL fold metallo-hydrolase [Lewinella sp. IMCC34191]
MRTYQDTDTLTVFESALFRTTTIMIVGSDHLLLVDPNWLPDEIDEIGRQVDKYKGDRDCHLLFTHSDYDHIIGYGRFRDFNVIASRAFVDQAKREDILQEIRDFDDQYYIERDYPILYPTVNTVIDAPVHSIRLGGEDYEIHQAPGHNDDSIVVLNRSRGILVAGDYLSNVEFPYVYDSVKRYRSTLDLFEKLLRERNIGLLIPGHGDPTDSQTEMWNRLTEARRYLNDLEESVRRKRPFDLPGLFRRYRFPKIMQSFHEGNHRKMVAYVSGTDGATRNG